jgi:hypothetical protein
MTIGGGSYTGPEGTLGAGGGSIGTRGGRTVDFSLGSGVICAIFFSVVGFFLSKRANIYILYQEYK